MCWLSLERIMPFTPKDYKEAAEACWPSKALEYPDFVVFCLDTEGWANQEELCRMLLDGYGPFLYSLFREDHPALSLIEKANASLSSSDTDQDEQAYLGMARDQIVLLCALVLPIIMMVGLLLALGPADSWHEGRGVPIV